MIYFWKYLFTICIEQATLSVKCTEQAVLTPIGRSDRKLLWLSSVINRGEPESLKNKQKKNIWSIG